MSETIEIRLNGSAVRVPADVTVAAALLNADEFAFRESAGGDARGPLCGMGVCHECRVTIDGVPHFRACLVQVAPDMEVTTDG